MDNNSPGQKIARHRVLKWLQPDASAAGGTPSAHNAATTGCASPFSNTKTATPQPATTTRQRIAALWKKWKSKTLLGKPSAAAAPTAGNNNNSASRLSPAVLKRHQQLCDLQRVSSVSIPPVYATAADVLAAATAAAAAAAATTGGATPPVAATSQADRLAGVYESPFYQPSTPKAPQTHNKQDTARQRNSSEATPRGVSVLRHSSSFNATMTSSDPSSSSLPPLAAQGSFNSSSRDLAAHSHHHQQQQHQAQPLSLTNSVASEVASSPAPSPAQQRPNAFAHSPQRLQHQYQQQQRPSPLQHSPQMFAGAMNSPLQQLLQAPPLAPQLPQMQPNAGAPAGLNNTMLPADTALTAYPAVAAAVNSVTAAAWLHRRWGPVGQDQQQASAVAPSAAHGGVDSPPAPSAATAAAVAALEVSTSPADVQHWLLRTALLEDELQGRALEVSDELQALQERRDLMASLAASLQSSSGSDAHGSAVAAAVQSLQGDRASSSSTTNGALYRAAAGGGAGAGGIRASSPGIRPQVAAEVTRLDLCITQLQSRAQGLGSALATLQGCQAVLGSSRATRLSPCSQLSVLQLVLSDVVARLPAERLQELPVLDGLPSLCATGLEICQLAAAASGIHASVQPLLSSAVTPVAPPPAVPQLPSIMMEHSVGAAPTAGLLRPGSALSVVSATSAATWSRPPQQQQQPLQEQLPWYSDLKPETEGCGGDDDDDDDTIIESLSSVLSSRHFTPRRSIAYESRKAAAAASASASSHAQDGTAVFPPALRRLRHPSGSAAAADAAALTLAGIASSGSWSNWPPAAGAHDAAGDAAGCSYSDVGQQHMGMWDMVCVHSPRSVASQHNGNSRWLQQPGSPSSATSSRRGGGGGSKASLGVGGGPSGMPYPLFSWPESPAAAAAAGGAGSGGGSPFAEYGAPLATAGDPAMARAVVSQILQVQMEGSGCYTTQPQQHNAPVLSQSVSLPPPAPAPQEALPAIAPHGCSNSRASSFESCVSARSRPSFDLLSQTAAGRGATSPAMPAHHSTASGSTHNNPAFVADDRAPSAAAFAPGAPAASGPATARRTASSAGSVLYSGANTITSDALLSSALPAGSDLNSMTVGQLLQVLTAAVTNQSQGGGAEYL